MTKDNHLLGQFELSGIPPAPRNVPQIEVTFSIDVDGILNVQAKDLGTGNLEQITITSDKDRLSEAEIKRMVKEAEEAAEEDKKLRDTVQARNQLENYAYSVKNTITDEEKLGGVISESEKAQIEKAVGEAISWLEENFQAEKEEYDAQYKELESLVQPIFSRLYEQRGGQEGGAGHDEF